METVPKFNWTGDLRPDRVGPYRHVRPLHEIIMPYVWISVQVPQSVTLPDYALNGRPTEEISSKFQRDSELCAFEIFGFDVICSSGLAWTSTGRHSGSLQVDLLQQHSYLTLRL